MAGHEKKAHTRSLFRLWVKLEQHLMHKSIEGMVPHIITEVPSE